MVSLWPWRGDDTSPASFEKSLSAVSAKIANATTRLDSRRQRSRRFKALWTLYSSFMYLLYLMIMGLVVGYRRFGPTEYTTIASGPLVIYLARLSIATYYDYRMSSLQTYVESLQKERDTTIRKLKAATKYDSTQQLLEKYGGVPIKPKAGASSNRKPGGTDEKSKKPKAERTSFVPPPTANIPGRNAPVSMPSTPQRSTPISPSPTPPFTAAAATAPWQSTEIRSSTFENEEFAPNAFSVNDFSAPHRYAQSGQEHKWYDRVLDVLLGEDESHPKNRLALICQNCRLVNGQAPPGIKQLEDVGKWRCSNCGTMNGADNEAERLVAEIKGTSSSKTKPLKRRSETSFQPPSEAMDEEPVIVGHGEDPESDVTQYSEEETGKGIAVEASNGSGEAKAETTSIRKGTQRGSSKQA